MLTPKAAIASVFRNYATFTGRATRSEYWWFQLFQAVIFVLIIAAGLLPVLLNPPPVTEPKPTAIAGGIGLLLFGLLVIIPNISVFVRRLHDIDFSGWFYFLTVIPGFGPIVAVVVALLPSNPAGARFDAVKKPGSKTPAWQPTQTLS
jgi:uncharacterized membrane protein YhaH (DUF805 family)